MKILLESALTEEIVQFDATKLMKSFYLASEKSVIET
jgi:hypothetical protein